MQFHSVSICNEKAKQKKKRKDTRKIIEKTKTLIDDKLTIYFISRIFHARYTLRYAIQCAKKKEKKNRWMLHMWLL